MKRILSLILVFASLLPAAVACKGPETPPAKHENAKIEQVEATCSANGVKPHWYCATCKAYFKDEACTDRIDDIDAWKRGDGKIPSLGHTVTKTEQVDATCSTDGVKPYWYCDTCKAYFKDEACAHKIDNIDAWKSGDGKIASLAHTTTKTEQVDATDTADGVKPYWYCSVCMCYFSNESCTAKIEDLDAWKLDDGKITASGHTEERIDQVDATCTTDGVKAHWYCYNCKAYFKDEACTDRIDDIDAWKRGDGRIASSGHSATKTEQADATATTDGVKAYWYCSLCKCYFSNEACTARIEDLDAWKQGEGKIPATGEGLNMEDYYNIIVEIARAYDRQGGQIPYDQKISRRSIFSSPEDATAQRTIFLDCSAFVNSCYREGFGVNVLPFENNVMMANTANYDAYAKENGSNADVIGYWLPANYTTSAKKAELVDWIYANLKIGDILTYRHGKSSATSGHTYIYIGNSTFMHCAGAGSYVANSTNPSLSYDSNATETEGTIDTISADTIFKNTSHKRYIFKSTSSDTVFSFGIIRPFARGLTPTQESLNRMKIAGLSMEKTSSIWENNALFFGTQLTYTIKLENTTNAAISGVTIRDVLPRGTVFVSGDNGVTVTGETLTWVGNVAAGSTVTVKYTVMITENTPGAHITSNETFVSGVKLGCITHTVSGFAEGEQATIAQTAKNYAAANHLFESSLDMVKAVYLAHGIDLFSYTTASEVLDLLIDEANLTHHTATALSDMLVPNLYGGLSIRYGWSHLASENEKTRLPMKEHLSVGDIVFADWSGGSVVYLYVGERTLVTVENGVCKTLTIGDNIFVEGDNILISLLGYDRYAVIRPGNREINMKEMVSISVTTPPLKLNYDNGERFDATGMVVTATMSDNTQMIISSYAISAMVLTPDITSVTVTVGNKTATVNVTVSDKEFAYGIEEASKLPLGETAMFEGIVIGVANEGLKNDEELLIKDINKDTVIAVRNLSGTLDKFYGYKVGDRILFKATVKQDTSSSTCYTLKKYLEFSAENGTQASTVISSGNSISYTFEDAVEINTWQNMQEFFVKATNTPYTYLKISGGFYLNYYEGTDSNYYRIHKNPNAAAINDMKLDGTSIAFREDVMDINLGANWETSLSVSKDSTFPGVYIDKDIYILYIGGNKSYYQVVILGTDWIS